VLKGQFSLRRNFQIFKEYTLKKGEKGDENLNDLFTIDCGDILLRELRIEDVDATYEITSQPEVYEYLPDWKSTREQRLDWVTNYEIPSNKKFLSAVPNIEEQNYLKLGNLKGN